MTADPLLEPFRLKHLTLKNRVMSTSHAIGYGHDEMPKQRYQLYHEEKAKGGIALTMFGGSSNVSRDSTWGANQLDVGDDKVIPYLREFAERIHAHGCALMCQITHLGRRGDNFVADWLPTIAPSRVRETMHRGFSKEMGEDDIARVVRDFGAAAARCREGGLDGIELLAGGHLIGQFLSPLENRRTDGYGGSLENRCRFGLMVFEEIRRRVGDGFIVGFRYIVDEGAEGGLGFDEAVAAARIFEASGCIDFFNAIYGRMDTLLALAEDNMPGMASPSAPFLDRVGAFKREVGLPVFHAARIADVATARHALRDGLVDMVAMTRGHIADPHIVNKIARGEEHRIRPCVGATYCMTDKRACIHNAAIGREARLPHVVPRAAAPGRKAVVVGGGPAGLEAARVGALRGHDVVLFEAAGALGGQVAIAARAGWRRELGGIVDWLAAELGHLGVDVRLNLLAGADEVAAEAPDVVIVATGGVPDLAWLDGHEHCVSTWDILTGAAPAADDVLIYDGTGLQPAISCADVLAERGKAVALVTRDDRLGFDLPYVDGVVYRKRLHGFGVPVTVEHRLERVERRGNRLAAVFANEFTGATLEREAEQIVVEHGTVPVDALYNDLRAGARNDGVTDLDALLAGRPQPEPDGNGYALHRVGDAVASRNIHAAILDSLRLCVTL